MNRHERRAAASRQRKPSFEVTPDNIYKRFDIIVEGKDTNADGTEAPTAVVMIRANAKGREITENLWPEVGWARDPVFSRHQPEDWQFTHVRVTQLPPHLQAIKAPEDTAGDALALAVTMALQAFAKPERVAHMVGYMEDLKINVYASKVPDKSSARATEVEYVPPTLTVAGTA